MNREYAKAIAPFVKAFGDGEPIWINLTYHGWIRSKNPKFDGDPDCYHIGDKPPVPDGSERVRELLKSGKPVVCGVSNDSQIDADKSMDEMLVLAIIMPHNCESFIASGGYLWDFACPVDQDKFAWEDKE